MRCKRAAHRVKNDLGEKMVKIDAVCNFEKHEFNSIATEPEDNVR